MYLKDTYRYSLQTKVKNISSDKMIEFEDTIFHPQGGGQPQDKGFILYNNKKYSIVKAQIDRPTGKVTIIQQYRYGTK